MYGREDSGAPLRREGETPCGRHGRPVVRSYLYVCVSCPRLRFGLLVNSTTYGHTEDFVLPPTSPTSPTTPFPRTLFLSCAQVPRASVIARHHRSGRRQCAPRFLFFERPSACLAASRTALAHRARTPRCTQYLTASASCVQVPSPFASKEARPERHLRHCRRRQPVGGRDHPHVDERRCAH